jgi:hypothetical protein
MNLSRLLSASVALAVLSGCVALGWQFAPGFASTDTARFATSPVVVHEGDRYTLSWTYGTDGFYFSPSHKVVDAKLVFSLQATSSTGSRTGKRGEMPIEGSDAVHALRDGGAWWWEPDGSFTKLDIVEAHPAL